MTGVSRKDLLWQRDMLCLWAGSIGQQSQPKACQDGLHIRNGSWVQFIAYFKQYFMVWVYCVRNAKNSKADSEVLCSMSIAILTSVIEALV